MKKLEESGETVYGPVTAGKSGSVAGSARSSGTWTAEEKLTCLWWKIVLHCMSISVYCKLTPDVDLGHGRVETAILIGGNTFIQANVTQDDCTDAERGCPSSLDYV